MTRHTLRPTALGAPLTVALAYLERLPLWRYHRRAVRLVPFLFVAVVLLGPLDASPARAGDAPTDLAAYVDGIVNALMLSKGIAGAAVSIVDRDGVLYERGYGVAARHPPRLVEPSSTLFRVGSISKTFTYVAAMQLVERHAIDLEADVNRYLPAPLQIPDEGFGPVRVWNLMTHTAGFEDAAIPHLIRIGDHPVETLDEHLARYRPHRVRPPGQHADYSNYSVALLGTLVAHVSGEPFESYAEKHLLTPLGMAHTTFREPLPEADPRHMPSELATDRSTPFRREQGGFKDEPYEHIAGEAPAGALSTTADDMARWMRMLLRGGELDLARVLAPDTFAEFARVTFRNAPDVSGIAHGLFRARYGRYESLEHAGATLAFMSNMVVLPEAGVGVFVSTNTETGLELAQALPRMVFERLLPDARPPAMPSPARDFEQTARRFTGSYVWQRRAYTTLEKLMAGAQAFTVSVAADALVLGSRERTTRWAPEGPLTFRSVDSGARMEFLEGPSGQIVGLATAAAVADKVGPIDDARTALGVLGALGLSCLGVLAGAFCRRGRPLGPYSRAARFSAVIVGVGSVTWLSFLVFFALALQQIGADPFEALPSYPQTALRAAVGLAYGSFLLTAGGAGLLMASWRSSGWPLGRTLRHALVLVTMLAAAAALAHWNVLFAPYSLG